jgi:peroxiredoxin
MYCTKLHTLLLLTSSIITLFCSCNKEFKGDNYTAYFGGEVTNPTNKYILFCRNSEVIDSVKIDANNRFFIKFDSLTPGMYTFKNEPEYQYVYFDKNDSIMLRVNAKDFDNSIIFCGRGDQKNNFLMEMYMKNEDDRSKSFDAFDYTIADFTKNIDSSYASKKKFYITKKEAVKWNDDFDKYAKASLDLHHYSKKEIYPMAHLMRTGEDVIEKLPKDFYDFRKEIDFNDTKLSNFSPFVMYLSHMLNNVSAIHYHNHYTPLDLALRTNINKLNFADSLIKNKAVKNTILNNIAFTYLLEDQNMVNNQIFLETYYKYSTDKSKKNEILKIGNAIQLLKVGNTLPKVELVNTDNQLISSEDFTKKKTILFLWTDNLSSHMLAAHKKILALKLKHPDYQFIGINLDKDQKLWKSKVEQLNHNGIIEYRCTNFEDLKANWAIMKVHRTIILDQNGHIKNAFTNLFDVNFEKEL